MQACDAEYRLMALDAATSAIVIAVVDKQQPQIRYANAAAHALYASNGTGAHMGVELFAGPPEQGLNAAWRATVRQGRAARLRGSAVGRDGRPFRIDVQVQPLDGPTPSAALYVRRIGDDHGLADEDMALAALDATAEELSIRDAEVDGVFRAFPGVLVIVDQSLRLRAIGGEALPDLGVANPLDDDCMLLDAFPDGAAAALIPLAEGALRGRRSRFAFFCAGRSFDGLASPVRVEAGDVESALLALHDVTDRNEAYAALAPATTWRP